MLMAIGLAVAASQPWSSHAQSLSEQERRGKQIYTSGKSELGNPVKARVGQAGTALPASALPCASCHGYDGTGRPERGVNPPNIAWDYLIKAYGHVHADGRRHPAFTEESVVAAILGGVDPAGNVLERSMPRYEMAPEDADDLVAYLKRLASDYDPGITDKALRVGTVLPSGRLAGLGDAVQKALSRYFSGINAGGGVHGRKIELVVLRTEPDAASILGAAKELIETYQALALVAVFNGGVATELAAFAEEHQIPLVIPLATPDSSAAAAGRYEFYLFPDLETQARVLVKFAAQTIGKGEPLRLGVVHTGEDLPADFPDRSDSPESGGGWMVVTHVRYDEGGAGAVAVAGALRQAAVDAVLYLASRDRLRALLLEAAEQGWTPDFLVPGALIGPDVLRHPVTYGGRVLVAYPTLRSDITKSGFEELVGASGGHSADEGVQLVQVYAHTAAKILVEGFKRTGRGLARGRLIAALETLYDFETGLTRPVRFGTSRHVGIRGAYITQLRFGATPSPIDAEWIELD